MTNPKIYQSIVDHYSRCLLQHGDSHLGVDWPNEADASTRYRVMLESVRTTREEPEAPLTLLDFGCGASHLHDFIRARELDHIAYAGLDAAPEAIALSKRKYPSTTYYQMDILDGADALPVYDYIIMNGVFTEKRGVSHHEMFDYFRAVLPIVFGKARRGIAFNVMSKAVDWERDDLFHLSTDTLISFLVKNLSRNFIIRNDYGLYEYTTYVYQEIDHGKSRSLWR
ncbi:MAG: class I SAM-dependent methyltransferase [Herminiimonas sp.]|nr:class I SAM-dependent methyltransferase [Herminiimonas sp.]